MGTLRTKETEDAYAREREIRKQNPGPCPLCAAETIREFTHWRIIANSFPYDLVAKLHHMIVTKRHAKEGEVTVEEWHEYQAIKNDVLHANYEFIIEPARHKRSIPEHFHLHMIVAKDPA